MLLKPMRGKSAPQTGPFGVLRRMLRFAKEWNVGLITNKSSHPTKRRLGGGPDVWASGYSISRSWSRGPWSSGKLAVLNTNMPA